MRHRESVVRAVAAKIQARRTSGGVPGHRELAILSLDATRAAEEADMKIVRVGLTALIDDDTLGRVELADAILADYHVSLKEEETLPIVPMKSPKP